MSNNIETKPFLIDFIVVVGGIIVFIISLIELSFIF